MPMKVIAITNAAVLTGGTDPPIDAPTATRGPIAMPATVATARRARPAGDARLTASDL